MPTRATCHAGSIAAPVLDGGARENAALRAELARTRAQYERLLAETRRTTNILVQQRDGERARCAEFWTWLVEERAHVAALIRQHRDAMIAVRRIREELCARAQLDATDAGAKRRRTLLVQLPADAPPRPTTITLPAAATAPAAATTIIRLPAAATARRRAV